jgi:hypothetical protein
VNLKIDDFTQNWTTASIFWSAAACRRLSSPRLAPGAARFSFELSTLNCSLDRGRKSHGLV